MHLEEDDELNIEEYYEELNLSENWILSRLNDTIERVNENMEKYLFGEVSKHLYDFIWSEFCDWYLELIKPELYDDDNPEGQRKSARVGQYLLSRILQLLHPIMPFITEEIWNKLPGTDGSIMLSDWPEVNQNYHDQAALKQMGRVQEIIKEIRNIRNEFTVNPGKKITAIFETEDKNDILTDQAVSYIKDLASIESLEIAATVADKPAKAASAVVGDIDIILPLEGMIDIKKEIKRLEKEADEIISEIKRSEGKLANQGFVNQAPEELVQAEREKLPQLEEKLEKVKTRIKDLKE
ncbi:MAG: class I tRNA ligase family protein [Halarsenatibacteraceae bacterium]